jgi:cytochrome oxidase Cu insertion factor (SCO1/SenC/PrrC family)
VTWLGEAALSPAPIAAPGRRPSASVAAGVRDYLASDSRRAYQTVLGLLWLLDGALQFQPFMYSNGFVHQLKANAAGQPHWLASTIDWAANTAHSNLAAFNTLFALVQVAIGLGLLYRRTVKPALALSIAWAFGVWWFGEGFGMLFAGAASPLTGAPGAVVLYALVALLVWPSARPAGLLSVAGARVAWGALWLGMAYLWLLPANSGPNATFNAIMMAPTGMSVPNGMAWLSRIDGQAELAALGHGTAIALVLSGVSASIALAVWANWRPVAFLSLAIVVSLGYWVIGQSFGAIVFTGTATDPNTGPLFVLLALVMYSLTPVGRRAPSRAAPRPAALVASLTAGVAIALAGTAVGVTNAETRAAAPAPQQPVAYDSPFDGLAISPPVPAPPVSLHNYHGDQITLSTYSERGDTVLLTFLSARCPANCAAIASGLHRAVAAMPAASARRLQVVVISTNPGQDNPRTVGGFLRRYRLVGRTQYLTGSPVQLRPIWTEWGISTSSDAVDLSGPNALVYGIAPTGAVMTRYSAFFTPQQILHDVKRLQTL